MHATTTTQLSNHSGAEKSKHRVFGHIFAMALVVVVLAANVEHDAILTIGLVAVVVLATEAAWVALLGYGLIFLFS